MNTGDTEQKEQKKPPLEPQKQPIRGFNWTRILWIFLVWILISYFFGFSGSSDQQKISYTSFKNNVTQGNVTEITVKGHDISGRFKKPVKGKKVKTLFGGEKTPEYDTFKTVVPEFEDTPGNNDCI